MLFSYTDVYSGMAQVVTCFHNQNRGINECTIEAQNTYIYMYSDVYI